MQLHIELDVKIRVQSSNFKLPFVLLTVLMLSFPKNRSSRSFKFRRRCHDYRYDNSSIGFSIHSCVASIHLLDLSISINLC